MRVPSHGYRLVSMCNVLCAMHLRSVSRAGSVPREARRHSQSVVLFVPCHVACCTNATILAGFCGPVVCNKVPSSMAKGQGDKKPCSRIDASTSGGTCRTSPATTVASTGILTPIATVTGLRTVSWPTTHVTPRIGLHRCW